MQDSKGKFCSTCGANLVSEETFVEFSCPKCGNTTIGRCKKCKNLSNKYKCAECGFEGP